MHRYLFPLLCCNIFKLSLYVLLFQDFLQRSVSNRCQSFVVFVPRLFVVKAVCLSANPAKNKFESFGETEEESN